MVFPMEYPMGRTISLSVGYTTVYTKGYTMGFSMPRATPWRTWLCVSHGVCAEWPWGVPWALRLNTISMAHDTCHGATMNTSSGVS